jgi:hypothetical protein
MKVNIYVIGITEYFKYAPGKTNKGNKQRNKVNIDTCGRMSDRRKTCATKTYIYEV